MTKVSPAFADLRKRAKKAKVEFDKETTEEELKVLVEAAEAAATAQSQKAGEPGPVAGAVASTPAPVEPEIKDNKAVKEKGGEQVLQTFTNRQKEVFRLILVKGGSVVIKKVATNQVIAEFATADEGRHYLENLSRF